MNIALERCKEIADGRLVRNWGDAFVRGNNGEPIKPPMHFFILIPGHSHIYLRRQCIDSAMLLRCETEDAGGYAIARSGVMTSQASMKA